MANVTMADGRPRKAAGQRRRRLARIRTTVTRARVRVRVRQAIIAKDADAYVAPLLQALAPSLLEAFMRARARKLAP